MILTGPLGRTFLIKLVQMMHTKQQLPVFWFEDCFHFGTKIDDGWRQAARMFGQSAENYFTNSTKRIMMMVEVPCLLLHIYMYIFCLL
jgi:hypothetical protein